MHAQLHIIDKIKTNIKLLLLAFHEIMNVTKSRNKIENCILLGTKKLKFIPEISPQNQIKKSKCLAKNTANKWTRKPL